MYKKLNNLIKKAKKGDIDAKEEILDNVQGLIFNSIKRYYNNKEEYEDLIQEGNVVVLASIENFDDNRGVHFLGYIKAMLKYTYLNQHKRRYHLSLNTLIGDEDDEWINFLETEEKGPLEQIIEKEELSQLGQALSKLTQRQREVLMAFYYDEIPMEKIAEKLGVSYRTVVNTKTRALEKIRQSI